MKFSTSPLPSRCSSPILTGSESTLPVPLPHRHNCMGAASKCYKYLRKLFKFNQMDFEFAIWQMVYLFTSPQKVYRNFQSRKQTKTQFARDDPAFLVLLTCWLCVLSIGFVMILKLSFWQFVKLLLYVIFIDYIVIGLVVATLFWIIMNQYLKVDQTQDVEWGYAFDIHLNALFPPLLIIHIMHLFLYNGFVKYNTFSSCFVGNTFWLISIAYYIYITFLGYASTKILRKTHMILSALPVTLLLYIITLCIKINVSRHVMEFYQHRVI